MKPRQFRFLILFSYFLSILFIGFPSLPMPQDHSQAIVDTVFSPDGRFIATASLDKSIIIWDAMACTVVRKIELDAIVSYLVYHPDGAALASGDSNGTISIWDAATGDLVKRLRGQAGLITSLDYSADGQVLISTSYKNEKVFVWDVESGNVIRRLDLGIIDPDERIRPKAAMFSPDGQFIAAANGEAVHLWNASTGAHLNQLDKASHFPNRISFHPDGQNLLSSGDGDVAAVLWELATGREIRSVSDAHLFRRVEAISPDGHYILSRYSNWLELWNAWTLEWVSDLGDNRYQLTSAAYSPNGHYIVSGAMDNQATIWDASTLEASCRLGESRR